MPTCRSVSKTLGMTADPSDMTLNLSAMRRDAAALIARIGMSLDMGRIASGLTLAEQQAAQIARALSQVVRVLIKDEPTASLSAHEAAELRRIAKTLAQGGLPVICISHRLQEVFQITDRVSVIRAVGNHFTKMASTAQDVVILKVENLGVAGVFNGISFDLRQGEVVAMALPIRWNTSLATLNRFLTRLNQINVAAEGQTATAFRRRLNIRTPDVEIPVGMLSGGDQQKVLLACAALLSGAFGLNNGLLVASARVPSIIVTSATMARYRSTLLEYSQGKSITTGNLPPRRTDFPNQVVLACGQMQFRAGFCAQVLVVVLSVVLERSGFGRLTYVIGSNTDVAAFAGIDTARHKMGIFSVSGLTAAFAGLLFAARVGAVRGDVGTGFELDVITIVLLGGVSVFGGKGTLTGTPLAILIVLNLRNFMALWNITGHIQTGVIGILLIAPVVIPRINLARRMGKAEAA